MGASEKHRFTSYERDSETGNDYAMNRHYGNAVGRFMQPDRVGCSPGAPQSPVDTAFKGLYPGGGQQLNFNLSGRDKVIRWRNDNVGGKVKD